MKKENLQMMQNRIGAVTERCRHKQRDKKEERIQYTNKERLWDWGKVLLQAAVILVVLFYACWPVRTVGTSMEPTVQEGKLIWRSRLAARMEGYEKGDVVLFSYEEDGERHILLKRIIATAGDTIAILPEGVFLNGTLLAEPYTAGETYGVADMTVPKGTVFVMGDNREESFDSRNMGVVEEAALQGKVLFLP